MMPRHPLRGRLQARRSAQRGVVMFVALIVLIIMTLAGLAMMRQLGANSSIAGNIAFKQGATSVADAGIESGRAWLFANTTTLDTDAPAAGYYASWGTGSVDPTSADWKPMWDAVTDQAGPAGNTFAYIVQRLCLTPNLAPDNPAQRCSDSGGNNAGGSKGGGSYGEIPFTPITKPFYRITARVKGPRNTVSYTQIVMN